MHVSFHRSELEDVAQVTDAAPRLTLVAAPPLDGGRYGESKRLSLPGLVAIVIAHAVALYALTAFDVIAFKKKPEPIVIDLVQEQAPPPEIVPPAPPPPSDVPPPPDQPAPLIASTAQTVTPPPIVVAPPPPAPVAAIEAPPPPAPIIPPDVDAATMSNPPPVYPIESRRRHEQGTVRLRVVITVEGRVKDISVARSSGFERLDKAALDAVRKWRFRPGTQAGLPVEAVGTLAIPFQLA